tara:strand:- start:217 stop:420 length:204 start_codon:yes stop_codon:yes gene_type:complete
MQILNCRYSNLIVNVFDGEDGRVARITNIQSECGAEYDTMADGVYFAITSALGAYKQALTVMASLVG